MIDREFAIMIAIEHNPTRLVGESESERQRARNGTSESERDFSHERATVHTSESKRAKFRVGRDFSFYNAYNRVAMSVASTEHIPGGPIKTGHSTFSRISRKRPKIFTRFFAHIKASVY